jgi:3-isopropylmalate dehydrogenase
MNYTIAVLPGDGIGAEVAQEAVKVLRKIGDVFGHRFEFRTGIIGGAAIDAVGAPLPDETLELCRSADAVLLGAVGGPAWDDNPSDLRPEKALLGIRKELQLFANLRPARPYSQLIGASSLRPEIIEGVDLLVVRELTGGLYFGTPRGTRNDNGVETAFNTLIYSSDEVRRIARKAFELARQRSRRLCSVDKANVLETSQLWRRVVTETAAEYPDVELTHMFVDNCSMQLIRNPRHFDVIVTENMFGDILSDEAAMLTGSIGMLPSASVGGATALYEPVHGSAPDIAGQQKANPIAMIASAAMMLEISFSLSEEAEMVVGAIEAVLEGGYRTADIHTGDTILLGTAQMGDAIAGKIIR